MKTLLSLFLVVLPFVCMAQVQVDGIDINKKEDISYVKLLASQKGLSTKVIISIDYGQLRKLFKASVIKDSAGKNKVFNSGIDALNFMEANGWQYIDSYPITVGNSNVLHYLLKKKEG